MIRKNRLKANLAAGRKSLGVWLQSADPTFAEIVALVGFDFFIMDQEHGPGDVQAAINMARAAAVTDATSLIRVPSSDPIYLRRIADAGAEGVLVPMVETADEARMIVDACRFPPRGRRGNAHDITRASGYGVARDYLARIHEEFFIAVQIETATGAQNARAIAAVEGVDLIFIGPTDLSGSIGLPGETNAPEVEALIAQCIADVKAAGKPLGTVPRRGKTWQALLDEGFLMLATGSEIYFFRTAAEALFDEWKTYQGGGRVPSPRARGVG